MKISLAEALPLRVELFRKIRELRQERDASSYIQYIEAPGVEVNEDELLPKRSMVEVTNELNQVILDYTNLDQIISAMNIQNTIDWKGTALSIQSAINLAKMWRDELEMCKEFARKKLVMRNTSYSSANISVTKLLYDPNTFSDMVKQLEKDLPRLSTAIEKKNHQVEFEFDAEAYLS